MSYDLYFLNHTKKQKVYSKKLYADFEDRNQLIAYLSFCNDDTIEVVGEGKGEECNYREISLWKYKITEDTHSCEREINLLYQEVFK